MCGIAGIAGAGDLRVVGAMASAQQHRGPDDAGVIVFDEERVALAHRRLSILDLSPAGHQPMSNKTGTVWITFNGEIYNYKEIRRELMGRGVTFVSNSDTEVLLAAYEAWGEECLTRLNGMFAFAIYDRRQRKIFAARDRVGIKPLYYFSDKRCFVFASEVKALFASPDVPREPDYDALRTPARFQISPYTGFKNIFKLPPGHMLTYSHGKLNVREYWRPIVTEQTHISEPELVDRLDTLLNSAVESQMVADVPVGLFLSGGLDSSIIAALMRRYTTQDIHAFTIRFADADQRYEKMPDDSRYARQVAERYGLVYHEFEIEPDVEELLPKLVWHLDEPLSDPAAINTYLIAKAARDQNILVLLNGMGGDEIFGGYRKQLACLRASAYRQFIPGLLREAIESGMRRLPVATRTRGLRTLRWAKRFFSFASLNELDRFLASDLSLSPIQFEQVFKGAIDYHDSYFYKAQEAIFAETDANYLTKMCLNDTKVFLPEHNLTYSDKATMAAGIESRPPLTDHRLIEFMFQLPPDFRIRGTQQKVLLKKVAKQYLPHNVVYRPKAAFGSPLRAWIRGPLSEMVHDLLGGPDMRTAELYDRHAIQRLIARDSEGVEDNALVIWTLLTVELWHRAYFSRESEAASGPAKMLLRA